MTSNSNRLSRRQFVQRALAVSAAFPGLKSLSRSVEASSPANPIVLDRYGPLLRDPHRILDLPEHFSYRVISRTGDRMADGLVVPGFPDGMAAFSGHTVGKTRRSRESTLKNSTTLAASKAIRRSAGQRRWSTTPIPMKG